MSNVVTGTVGKMVGCTFYESTPADKCCKEEVCDIPTEDNLLMGVLSKPTIADGVEAATYSSFATNARAQLLVESLELETPSTDEMYVPNNRLKFSYIPIISRLTSSSQYSRDAMVQLYLDNLKPVSIYYEKNFVMESEIDLTDQNAVPVLHEYYDMTDPDLASKVFDMNDIVKNFLYSDHSGIDRETRMKIYVAIFNESRYLADDIRDQLPSWIRAVEELLDSTPNFFDDLTTYSSGMHDFGEIHNEIYGFKRILNFNTSSVTATSNIGMQVTLLPIVTYRVDPEFMCNGQVEPIIIATTHIVPKLELLNLGGNGVSAPCSNLYYTSTLDLK